MQNRSKREVLEDIRRRVSILPGMNVTIGQPISHRIDHMLSGTRADIAVKIFGDDLPILRALAKQVLGFQHLAEADRFLEEFRERLRKFGLELHPDKTRRIEFGRFAEINRNKRGEGKPGTFDFLGFTHISGKDRKGGYAVKRKTISKRMRAKLLYIRA